ncbi:MAG: metallophosphoesterase [Candidatus Woesearchaeota archaeon]
MNTQELIEFYLEQNILISPSLLEHLSEEQIALQQPFMVLNSATQNIIKHNIPISVDDFEKALVLKEKYKKDKLYTKFLEYIKGYGVLHRDGLTPAALPEVFSTEDSSMINVTDALPAVLSPKISQTMTSEELKAWREAFMKQHRIKILQSYDEKSRKRTVQDFINYFNVRFKDIEKILRGRQELQNLTSIARINAKKERENIAIIGYVYEKSLTKNKNIMFTIEDQTGVIKVVVSHAKEELFRLAEEIQLDEVIGITGMYDNIVFANSILLPDISLTRELKKSSEEGYFVVIADTQFGSKLFLDKEFKRFIAWMQGEAGSAQQREIASKVKYLFIPGDLVDGVGIYPGQEQDLAVTDITEQYRGFSELIKELPHNLPIIITPGNHDVGRIGEPQPKLDYLYTQALTDIPNIISVGNPAVINIYEQHTQGFEGFNVLLYHGYSFVYYAEHVPSIRQKGAQKRPDLISRYLLQRRHLAPTHTSALYIPDPKKDFLVLEKVPDFFFSGHIHRASVSNYRNVTCINASCWVSQSDEQERRGLEAQPGRAFIINMQTREVKVMNFLSREDQEKELGDIKPQSESINNSEN